MTEQKQAVKYTKKERLAIAHAFKEAKKYLWDGRGWRGADRTSFICYALESVEDEEGWSIPRATVCRLAQLVVRSRLNGCYTVGQWLRQAGVPEKHLTDKNVQAYRHRWLDELIREFSQ